MKIVRRFLVAPALARLIRKERGSGRATEGYFATQAGRNSHVALEGGQSHLVLITQGPGGARAEERTEVPRAHAEALLDVCTGRVVYDRTRFPIGGGREAQVDRFATPGPLDVVAVEFDEQRDADAFQAPAWFGAEVTTDPAYDNRAIALEGVPATGEVALTNAGLDAVLDGLENRYGASRIAPAPRRGEDVMEALRRAAAPSPAPALVPVEPEEPALPVASLGDLGEPAFPAVEPVEAPAPAPERQPAAATAAPEAPGSDTRIDDVFQGLSQALSGLTAGSGAPEAQGDVIPVQRWAGRSRRAES